MQPILCSRRKSQISLSQNSENHPRAGQILESILLNVKKEQCLASHKHPQIKAEQGDDLRSAAVEPEALQRGAEVQRCKEVLVGIKGQYICIMHTIFSSASMKGQSKVTTWCVQPPFKQVRNLLFHTVRAAACCWSQSGVKRGLYVYHQGKIHGWVSF